MLRYFDFLSTAILPVTLSRSFEAHSPTLTPVFRKGIRDSPKGRKIRWQREREPPKFFQGQTLNETCLGQHTVEFVPMKTGGSIFLLGIHLGNESIRGSKTQWHDQPKNFSLFSSEEMCGDISLVASAYRKLRNFLEGCIDSKCAKRMGGKLKP